MVAEFNESAKINWWLVINVGYLKHMKAFDVRRYENVAT